MEKNYGQPKRIWAMDRGIIIEDNIQFLRAQSDKTHASLQKRPARDAGISRRRAAVFGGRGT
jgi:hypothetical protein